MFDGAKACDLIACGESTESAWRKLGNKRGDGSAIVKRAHSDPVFAQDYARAMAIRAERDVEKLLRIGDRIIAGEIAPDAGRVAADIIKWTAARRAPKVFGDKLQLDGDLKMEVTVNDPTLRARATVLTVATQLLPKPDDDESA